MDRSALKILVVDAVGRHAEGAIRVARDIAKHAETGFREERTAGLVADWFREHGLTYRSGIALTGLRADVRGGDGPTVAVMGELDSLIVPGHPGAAPGTNAAHACGHHAQVGIMLAVAAALNEPGIREALGGSVAFMALRTDNNRSCFSATFGVRRLSLQTRESKTMLKRKRKPAWCNALRQHAGSCGGGQGQN